MKLPLPTLCCFLCLFAALPKMQASLTNGGTSESTPLEEGKLDLRLLTRLVTEETNKFRASHRREALDISQTLGKAAQDHAHAMTQYGFFAHRNPHDPDQRDLTDRMHRVGLQPQACGENIAMNFSRDFEPIRAWSKSGRAGQNPGIPEQTYRTFARKVVQQWIDSRGHRENLLRDDFTEIGLGFSTASQSNGYETIYCVQNFSSSASRYVRQVRFQTAWN